MYVQICNTFSNSQIKTNSGINFPVNRRVPTRFAEIPANASRHFAIYFSSLTIAYLQSQVNVKYLLFSPLPLLPSSESTKRIPSLLFACNIKLF